MLLLSLTICCTRLAAESLPEWMQPGVRKGVGSLEKRLFLNVGNIGTVTDIQRGNLRSPGVIELGVAGNYGARFFDQAGKTQATVDFVVRTPMGARVSAKIVKQSRANGLLFLRQSGPARIYDSVVDSSGKEVWQTPFPPLTSTFGDLKGEGAPEFVFAGEDSAIEARDVSGAVIWRNGKVGWAYKVDFVEPEEGRQSELLVDVSGTLVGLGTTGEILFKRKPAIDLFFSDFSTLRWPTVCQGQCLLISGNDKIFLLTLDAEKVVTQLDARYLYGARGVAVRFHEKQAPLLAVAGLLEYQGKRAVGFEAVHSALYVFDAHRNLVYNEVLPERVEALGVLPAANGKSETLLVGGENKVWQYSAPLANTSHSPQVSN